MEDAVKTALALLATLFLKTQLIAEYQPNPLVCYRLVSVFHRLGEVFCSFVSCRVLGSCVNTPVILSQTPAVLT